jgi:hypothetical protein
VVRRTRLADSRTCDGRGRLQHTLGTLARRSRSARTNPEPTALDNAVALDRRRFLLRPVNGSPHARTVGGKLRLLTAFPSSNRRLAWFQSFAWLFRPASTVTGFPVPRPTRRLYTQQAKIGLEPQTSRGWVDRRLVPERDSAGVSGHVTLLWRAGGSLAGCYPDR